MVFLMTVPVYGAAVFLGAKPDPTDRDIQAALDRLREGAELILPAGTFEIHSPIVLQYDGQILRGSGLKTIFHLADKANCPVVILGSPNRLKPITHIHLCDLIINGNRLNQQAEFWRSAADGSQLNNNGIDVWNVNDASVERVVCCSCRSGGLVTAMARRLTVCDFTAFDNQFDGLACYFTEDSSFKGLKLYSNLAAGISLDLSFNHNTFDDTVLTGNELGIFMRQSRNNSFQNLTITKSKNQGVFMAQTGHPTSKGWMPMPGTECTNNSFDGLTISECGGDAFTIHDRSCKNNAIQKARFVKNHAVSLAPTQISMVNAEIVPLP